jgi:hypothetical protein
MVYAIMFLPMPDLYEILNELRQELQELNEAILIFERLAESRSIKRRGRPPKWLSVKREKERVAAHEKPAVTPKVQGATG